MFHIPAPEDIFEAEHDVTIVQKAAVVHNFFWKNKLEQRRALSASGLPIPWTSGVSSGEPPAGQFVTRPLRHSGGADYALTPQLPTTGQGYTSAIFPKDREYRIIFIYGEPVVFLRKRVPEGTGSHLPWNHAVGGTFQTINDIAGSKPSQSGAIEALRSNPVIRAAHIVGVDILWRRHGQDGNPDWCVVEFNSSPALTIDGNLAKVAAFIKERHA